MGSCTSKQKSLSNNAGLPVRVTSEKPSIYSSTERAPAPSSPLSISTSNDTVPASKENDKVSIHSSDSCPTVEVNEEEPSETSPAPAPMAEPTPAPAPTPAAIEEPLLPTIVETPGVTPAPIKPSVPTAVTTQSAPLHKPKTVHKPAAAYRSGLTTGTRSTGGSNALLYAGLCSGAGGDTAHSSGSDLCSGGYSSYSSSSGSGSYSSSSYSDSSSSSSSGGGSSSCSSSSSYD